MQKKRDKQEVILKGQENAITLIALVVTIVVLLILARNNNNATYGEKWHY